MSNETVNKRGLNPFLTIPQNSDFSIYNLPFGIFSAPGKGKRAGIAIGEYVVDLADAADEGLFEELDIDHEVFESDVLNEMIALGKPVTNRIRTIVQEALCDEKSLLKSIDGLLVPMENVTMHMPLRVGDYTDFYSSKEHATNVGSMFRDPMNALMPNWKHLPVGYHGRSSSIVVSGTEIQRPNGQILPEGADEPVFAPTERLDFELEVAFVIGKPTMMGEIVNVEEAEDHIFGLMLFNDWSARDIQKWEYRPLGPFLGKSFASTVSPWIVPIEALEPFRVKGPEQNPKPLEYLRTNDKNSFDIQLAASIRPEGSGSETTVCETNFRHLYWSMGQQLVHHTSNGCNIRIGDLMASGTISGPDEGSLGCLLEITQNGSKAITLDSGEKRTWLEDGDRVTLRGFAEKDGIRVGFGESAGKIRINVNVS
ncbi:MAG: fumarylacetoacetase [Balneolaceae bacterium]|nr:fumarylacetoacetase [Balneolaceae bacterium]MCH8549396.1 fumarylacetoacetase [Balneolaceae bacterium]